MPSVKISNATRNAIRINYAIVEKSGDKVFRKIISVDIAPRALLQNVEFPNDEYYNAFIKQNESLIESGKIVLGSANESKLENASNDIAESEKSKVRNKKNKVIENMEKSVNNEKTKLNIKVNKA